MRIFVGGASGAIGKQLVPRLVAAGHEVHGMSRSESKKRCSATRARCRWVANALDRDEVASAVDSARPDVIVHELTAIGAIGMRHFDRDFPLTNRLRTEGTDHLLSAGKSVGVGKFVAQGVAAAHYMSFVTTDTRSGNVTVPPGVYRCFTVDSSGTPERWTVSLEGR